MKRLLLPASALVLVLTACGAGAKPAPRVAEAGARVPNVHVVAAQRKRTAMRDARRLLREFVPPPRARPTRQPRNYGGVLRQWGAVPVGEVVDVHRFWRVHKSLGAVATYVRRHRIRGLERRGTTYGTRPPHYHSWSFVGPPRRGLVPGRSLNVTAVALPGRTVIRVDALVVWIYPRSPKERVPAATRDIVVRAPKVSAKVTDPAKVVQIVRWFDTLPISPPGVVLLCPLTAGADITVSFRSAGGAWLAQAKLPPTAATICNTIAFQIGGRAQKPLIDRDRHGFVRRLQDLLHVHLVEARR